MTDFLVNRQILWYRFSQAPRGEHVGEMQDPSESPSLLDLLVRSGIVEGGIILENLDPKAKLIYQEIG